jgi:hypothetical protein
MRRWGLAACALVVCISVRAQVSVDESSTRAKLVNGVTTVVVAIRSSLTKPVEGRADLEWLDTDGTVRGMAHAMATFPPGASNVEAKLPISDQGNPLFYRLRYRLMPGAANLIAFQPAEGVLSLPHIADHAFVLTCAGIGTPRVGRPYELRVFASHPITGKPTAGVVVKSEKEQTTTDSNGAGIIRLLPDADEWNGESDVTIEGRLGDLVQKIDARLPGVPRAEVRIQTDKPLYQPGQTLHARLLAIGVDGHARADASYSIHIRDEHSTVMHAADVQTSRFGIASTNWEIPSNATTGQYSIEIEDDDGNETNRKVEIRRYELPSFKVSVQPDRSFYLAGQNASVEVRADYLFGKPVAAGKVRISQADEDEPLHEGALGPSAGFKATIDLSKALEDARKDIRYVDLHYTAYVTDATTNRTEQRRFDLRVSRDAIHIYVVRAEQSETRRPMYVTTYTPDGKPAECDVEILSDGKKLGSGRTNRLGVARIDVALPEDDIVVRARASGGAVAEIENTPGQAIANLRLDTDRVLYRVGQPVQCDIAADRPDLHVTLLAWREDRVLFSRELQLQQGRGRVVIPYEPRFGRELSIGVVSAIGFKYQAARRVIYPGPEDLRVAVHPAAATYRPGEQASLSLRAETAAGTPAEAAFGIAVVDQSVFERAETDSAMRRHRWFDYRAPGDMNIAGFTWRDLLNLDPKSINDEFQLIAEVLREDPPLIAQPSDFLDDQRDAFTQAAGKLLRLVEIALDGTYHRTLDYPTDDAAFLRIATNALSLDPWRHPYRPQFSIEGPHHVLRLISAGPDKQFGTADDLEGLVVRREWFFPVKVLIRQALDRLTDYPTSPEAFSQMLLDAGLNLDRLRDPWGNALRPVVSYQRRNRIIKLQSPGPDHVFGTNDDFTVAEWSGAYFQTITDKIHQALNSAKEFPVAEDQFLRLLTASGVDVNAQRDPWGHPYYITFGSDTGFIDRVQIYTYSEYNGTAEQRKQITPTKRTYLRIEIRSRGEDGVRDTYDDFAIAEFSRVVDENKLVPDTAPSAQLPSMSLGGKGAITGVVTDASGATIPYVQATLNEAFMARTDDNGRYYFRGVPPGTYNLRFYLSGFQPHVVRTVPVRADHVTQVDVQLQVGSVSEKVMVEAAVPMINTSVSSLAMLAPGAQVMAATSTPRVRDYFPETLLWQPELISDAAGRARLNFKLADSITTWHVAVMASTVDGQVTEAETEVRAIQPFFVDLDPPQVLTAGDEIALPVPIRNYLATEEAVSLDVVAPPALAVVDAPKTVGPIAPSSSVSPLIRMRAASAAPAEPKLRITARSKKASDAIEKSISIHPDGEPVSRAASDLLEDGRLLRVDVPSDPVPGSVHAEVKLYPTLLAQVIESMESMLLVPTGCGEQTISSAYPNLLFLRALKDSGLTNDRLEKRARHNLEMGYRRLLGYRTEKGGFAYWAKSDADAALTAYAIGFLEDAHDIITVDESIMETARGWLQTQNPEDIGVRSVALRALAHAGSKFQTALIDRLGELARSAGASDDPYAIATFALAALDANRPELARPAIERLRGLVRREQSMAYWHLQRNTPYYGWGRAGQIEATALAVSALSRWQEHSGADPELKNLIDQGVLFLFRNKDHSGVWLTTQATIRVFSALLDVLANGDASKPFTAEVHINGVTAARVPVPGGRTVQGPVVLDVTRFIKTGVANEVAVSVPGGHGATQTQFTASWYQPWSGARSSPELAMTVRYSTTETSPNEPVHCAVAISRPAFRGYGMMIAEIGLPPGAEVDRGALSDLLEDAKTGVDSVEVAPDRVVFYVWPRAADSKLQFTFRPRYPIHAHSAPSLLYDYYNPDARVVLPAEMFTVK